MITILDVLDLVYRDVRNFGLPVYKMGNIPDNLSGERITINVKTRQTEKYWNKCFVNVNIIVPDNKDGMSTARLKELDRKIVLESTSRYDDTSYQYSEYSTQTESGEKYHYINKKLLFEILNTK